VVFYARLHLAEHHRIDLFGCLAQPSTLTELIPARRLGGLVTISNVANIQLPGHQELSYRWRRIGSKSDVLPYPERSPLFRFVCIADP